jgi:NAD(P)-dependent dehydrogenase (short-subunit alcohol dehydrogenase family)
MESKNYFIVGASSGIGLELAKTLHAEGHHVFGTYFTKEHADLPTGIHYQQLDVRSESLDFTFLPDSLNGIVYCPGAISLKPFARISPAQFKDDFDLQVLGAIKCIQGNVARLKAGVAPSILLFSSIAASQGLNFHTQVSVSKAALEGLTKSLAAELAPTIRVNCIAPSLTDTPLAQNLLNSDQKKEANGLRHPMKRVGTVADMADYAAFLLSEKASWVTGQIIGIDGGLSTLRI